MPKPNILLIQARDAGDPMAEHELACVSRRLGLEVNLHTRNALTEPAHPGWLDNHDALIIGGSGDYSVHDPRSATWVNPLRRLLDAALAQQIPGFGICFGHQLVGLHFGSAVHTHAERAEAGTIDVTLTDAGRLDELFGRVEPVFAAHTGHSDHVEHVPAELELLASSDALHTQAFRVRGHRFYTTQFHPDLTGAEAIARYEAVKRRSAPGAVRSMAHFRPGADEAVTLLAAFVEVATQ